MKLKDVIHFYLGCRVFIPENGKIGMFTGIDIYSYCSIINIYYSESTDDYDVLNDVGSDDERDIDRIKPILRRLEDMTKDEKLHLVAAERHRYDKFSFLESIKADGELICHLCREGFDIFGLIDLGQAIDAKTLEG